MSQTNSSLTTIQWSKAQMTEQNPIGLYGVDFLEYSGPQGEYFEKLFSQFGFAQVATHATQKIKLYRQGDINFIINTEPHSFAQKFSQAHGPSVSATGFRVADAQQAYVKAIERGARPYGTELSQSGDQGQALPFPAVYGIGNSLIYFIDEKNYQKLYSDFFKLSDIYMAPKGQGLKIVDHFTNNVPVGEMQYWCDFYEKVFNFREARYFDIKGKTTGLISKVMRSPCSKFSVPINEPSDSKSQIQEYLDEYKGSGIQHIAMITDDIVPTLEALKENQVQFLSPPPNTYYKQLKDRLPQVSEDVNRLEKNAILVDGDHDGYLLQIFTKNVIGPVFYEVIQRKGHQGFGEGNFQALFDAIEADQRERGYL